MSQEMRTKLDEKMMHNVRTAVKDADAVLVILDATEDAAAALSMVNLGPDWRGPPVALVRGATRNCL
jgi:GTPase Era involved in 16S rRNA processing